jgi:hypothetical protein
MNPFKEKAKELVDKFSTVGLQQRNEGIACALIAVDEIINLLGDITNNEIDYWELVKKEIENL